MQTIRRILFVAAATLFCIPIVFGQKVETLFYAVDTEESFQDYKANIGMIDIVGPQSYRMDEFGTLWGSVDRRILDLAKKNNVKVMPLVVNAGFDQPAFHRLLHDSLAITRAIGSLVSVCKENGYYGIQFDFEDIHVTDKDAFTEFYRKTAEVLHANGFAISVAVVPRSSDLPGPTSYHKWIFEYWRGAYDYRALARIGDFISLMTYDQHTYRTTPGPVAGLQWMEEVITFVTKEVPAGKISLGIPFYSYRWYPSFQNNQAYAWGQTLGYSDAMGLAERFQAEWKWDDREKVHYTFYENAGLNEYIYLEDQESFKAKMELVKKYKFRGISVWRLGGEDPGVWRVLGDVRR
jgi:spore germination protein